MGEKEASKGWVMEQVAPDGEWGSVSAGTVADRISVLRYPLRQEEARVFTLQIQATSTTLGMSSSWRKDQEEGLRWKVRVFVGNFRMGSGILSV